MRQYLTYGSVRGVLGNRDSYRDAATAGYDEITFKTGLKIVLNAPFWGQNCVFTRVAQDPGGIPCRTKPTCWY